MDISKRTLGDISKMEFLSQVQLKEGRRKGISNWRRFTLANGKRSMSKKTRPIKTQRQCLCCVHLIGVAWLHRPSHECRQMIQDLRAAFYQKSYNEQNYVLLGLIKVRVCPTGHRMITYSVPMLGTVCRGAFQICYRFSHRKLQVLLNKLDEDGVSIQQDIRGWHRKNTLRILPEARRAITDFISKKATESHYWRWRTRKRYFDCCNKKTPLITVSYTYILL